ncbi:histidinol-phosphate transaminase [Buchananella hordeovulneris]|uniref:Histidinol-phosphate aminotransferase n=1 Tax=Buchananella hordeovulneris TaxID=52770 RepID=A0A1Q5PT61_9ACTO|nr:histidinol-phosphate transaminase [Buchananella hordeovulneris]OKL50758.1 histidinol-phosphate transaminase [Buchananella hordeovulneris]
MTSHPRLRPALTSLPAYVPGARPRGYEVKLSSNENPFPPSAAVVEAVARAAEEVHRYPDMTALPLRLALANELGVEADQLVAGNGSVAVLSHVLAAVCEAGDEVVMPWRSFEAYPIAAVVAGARPVQVPLTSEHRHDIAGLLAAITDRTRAVLVCSPNNPTGTVVSEAELAELLAGVPREVLVVLDEAYRDFAQVDGPVADGVELLRRHPNLLVLRTFSKAYALAGLRVGYAVAGRHLAAAVQATATPFGVNALGQAAALAALGEGERRRRQVTQIVAERERVVAELRSHGWHIGDSRANFFWFAAADHPPQLVTARCAAAGVLVRAFPEGVRVSVGQRTDNDRLLSGLGRWSGEK